MQSSTITKKTVTIIYQLEPNSNKFLKCVRPSWAITIMCKYSEYCIFYYYVGTSFNSFIIFMFYFIYRNTLNKLYKCVKCISYVFKENIKKTKNTNNQGFVIQISLITESNSYLIVLTAFSCLCS